jgi:adenine phosphoribosyltransferase
MAQRRRAASPRAKKPALARRSPTPRGAANKTRGAANKERPRTGKKRTKTIRPAIKKGKAEDFDLDPMAYAQSLIRAVPDFPKPGILFRDITPLLADARGFHVIIDAFAERFVGKQIQAIVAIESRGFIFGAALAARLNVSFVPVRRPGKLPADTDRVSYALEYGENELEIHRDALSSGARVIIIDDLLATGGTAAAAAELVERQGAQVAAFAFVIELGALGGRRLLAPTPIVSLMNYD